MCLLYGTTDNAQVASIGDIAVVDTNEHLSDEADSEDEEDKIKPTDNLVLVGHVDDDAASLEVYGMLLTTIQYSVSDCRMSN